MVIVNDDYSIWVTRGDAFSLGVTADDNGSNYVFQPGDTIRFKVFGKKNCDQVLLVKDFPVTEATQEVVISLTGNEMKLGGVISKATDFWYEVELNPLTYPQTIIGFDDFGPKILKLFPEGRDLSDGEIPDFDTLQELAYETAVAYGFQGSIEQWLESLIGPAGHTPERGKDYWTEEDLARLNGYVSAAGTAAQRSENAAEKAEQERSAAETARTGASNAAAEATRRAKEAQEAVENVGSKVEEYLEKNPPAGPSVDLTAVEKKIEKNRVDISDLKNVLIRKTAEGSVIPVTDCADFPLMKFEMDAAFEGVGIDISSINRLDCTQVKCKDGSIPELYGNGFIINPIHEGVNAVIVPCHLKKGISYSISFDYKFLGEDRHDFNFYLPEEGVNIPASITPIKDVHYLGLRADGNYVGSDNALQVTNFLVRQEGMPKVWTPYREETTVVWNGELTPELRTLDVPTVISNRAGADMELVYAVDPVKYIENKITELAALTLEV